MKRVAFDTNVLAYMAGVERHPDDGPKVEAARSLVARLAEDSLLYLPVQVMGELFTVLTRAGASREEARETLLTLRETMTTVGNDAETFVSALDLAINHQLQIWDSLILTAAAEAGCSMLLTEDMQTGFIWRGVRVANPFSTTGLELIGELLGSGRDLADS